MSRTQSSAGGAQVLVVADDPVEAGMLALDLVQAGVTAQAVRDAETAVEQLLALGLTSGVVAVVVAAHRDLAQTVALSERLAGLPKPPAFIAVVLRSQRDAAVKHIDDDGWTGVAVRPVNAEELVGLVHHVANSDERAHIEIRSGELQEQGLLDLLGGLIERIPRPGLGKSAVISLVSAARRGTIALLDGELVHAEADGELGRHSLERMACWRRGTWRLEMAKWSGPSSLSGPALALFAVAQEYARRVEEARQSLPYTDCVCSVRWERVRPLPVVAESLFRRIATGQVLGEALAGEGDDELEAFAALEARFRRGAVVPQVETGPRAAEAPTPGALADLGPRPPTERIGIANSHDTAAIQRNLTPLGMVDSSALPDRRHSHPTTHVYRVGADNNYQPTEVPDLGALSSPRPPAPVSATMSTLPDRHAAPTAAPLADRPAATRAPTPLHTGGIGRRAPSSLLAVAARGDSGLSGAQGRNGPISGWFGVQPAGEQRFPETESTYNPRHGSSTRVQKASAVPGDDRLSARHQSSSTGSADQRVAARPYAWIPAAQLEEEAPEAPPPKPLAILQPKNWPWVMLALVAMAAVVWLAMPRAKDETQVTAALQPYLAAVALLDGGHGEEALRQLSAQAADPNAVAEVQLHLAVLHAEAHRAEEARKALQSYLAHPQARHAERAKRMYQQWFVAPALPASPPQPSVAPVPGQASPSGQG